MKCELFKLQGEWHLRLGRRYHEIFATKEDALIFLEDAAHNMISVIKKAEVGDVE